MANRHRSTAIRHAVSALASGIIVLSTAGLLAHPAQAQTQALDFTGGNSGSGSGSNTLGWSFTLSSTVAVTQLGLFDTGNDGFINSHQVGLWDNVGNLLASTTLGPGLSGTPVISGSGFGAFRYVNVSPVVISPGTYVLGALYGTSDADTSFFSASSTTMAPGFTFVFERGDAVGGGFGFPSTVFANNGFFGPNLRFGSAAAAPEPGSQSLLALGALTFGVGIRIRRRYAK